MTLEARIALVTGAASGIGAATALLLAQSGAVVIAADKNLAAADAVARSAQQSGWTVHAMALDVTEPIQHLELVTQVESRHGGLDIAVNCAGISVGRSGVQHPVHETALEDWHDVMNVDVNGIFYGLRAQIPALIRRGGGAIVNVASVMSVVARDRLSPYVTAKHAVLGLTRAAAIDAAPHGIRINAVGPGYVDTALLAYKPQEVRERYARLHALNRMALAEEVAESILWLCGPKSSFSTGAFHAVDGGYTAL